MFYFQYHFLENCNLRCTHCYQHDWTKEVSDNSYLQSVVDEMEKALVKWNFEGRISLTGGEPFLYPEKLFYLIDSLENSEPFKWIGILTNGTLINEEISLKLTQFKKIKEIQISLDGADETTHDNIRGKGSFQNYLQTYQTYQLWRLYPISWLIYPKADDYQNLSSKIHKQIKAHEKALSF